MAGPRPRAEVERLVERERRAVEARRERERRRRAPGLKLAGKGAISIELSAADLEALAEALRPYLEDEA